MRFTRVLRVQTQAIMDLNLAVECQYCKSTEALSVELDLERQVMDHEGRMRTVKMNIEDLFNEFLIEKNEKMPNYGFQAWIRYFKANA